MLKSLVVTNNLTYVFQINLIRWQRIDSKSQLSETLKIENA